MLLKTAGEPQDFIRSILTAVGADEPNAVSMAEALVSSNLCGVDTHGVWTLPASVTAIGVGCLRRSEAWRVRRAPACETSPGRRVLPI